MADYFKNIPLKKKSGEDVSDVNAALKVISIYFKLI